ncbi:PhnD/SsuA/transferrin family substrate-binding protein [Hoeflea alexandrii]|uniref:phosphate/phosphite/phosphonate ABC transporter substrate-binding protein n=1 Tax=Hoeflea alexandrii TaxID=288436 RepID=UPI0035CFBBA9
MTGAVSLPMYDWPEVREATDRLWVTIQRELTERGIDAPESLLRCADPEALWTDPSLLLSQTCGYPYATMLAGKVALIGTPAHAVSGAAPGRYFSVLVARKGEAPRDTGKLAERRFAFNMAQSQSGFAAPARLLAATGHASLPQPLETGAHRASICAVAEARADWAAIDAVTWELAKRHEPAASDLVVFATTPQTPALPLITGSSNSEKVGAIADAVEAAIAAADTEVRDALFITGLTRFRPADYAPLSAPVPARQAFPNLE